MARKAEGRGRTIIGQLIKSIVYIIAILIVSISASAYVWYFIGMAVSLAAGSILGITGASIANIFAWAGMAITAILVIVSIASGVNKSTKQTMISEEEFEKLFGDVWKE